MIIILLSILPAVVGRSKLKSSVLYTEHDRERGYAISVSGKMPNRFEMSYSVSQNDNLDAALFVMDGVQFDFKSPSSDSIPWEREESASPNHNACNEVTQINADRTVHISFVGDQSTTAMANTHLHTDTFVPHCHDNVSYIILDAFIRGLGIILIFFCFWLLLSSLINKNSIHLRPASSRSKLREGRASSTATRASKEYKDSGVDATPMVNDARIGGTHTHVPPASIKRESASRSESHSALSCESDTETDAQSLPENRRFQSPRSRIYQPSSDAPALSQRTPATSNVFPSSAISQVSPPAPALAPAPAVQWTPHTDVSKVSGSRFAATPAVLLPPERNLTPPPPPPKTIPNFNPILGLPRPAKIEKILQVYDFIFLIDDSGSMMGSSWSEARESVNQLANWILDNGWDRDGITLRFLNSNHLFRFKDLNGISDKNKIRQLVDTVLPNGGTPTGKRCNEILDAHINKLERAKYTSEYATIKPLILVVITDGQPTDGHDFALSEVLLSASKRLADYRHHPNSMAIQFVQVGGDPRASQALKLLTQLETNGMVDAITSNDLGSLSPDKLGQLMLGGVHPNVRARRT